MAAMDAAGNPFPTRSRVAAGVFLAGALAQTAQVVLLRELLMAFSGLEATLGIVLGAWMALVAAGAALAGPLIPKRLPPAPLFGVLLGSAFLPLGGSALLARLLPASLGLVSGQLPGLGASLGLSLAALAPTGLFVGALFVASARALESARGGDPPGASAGRAYLLEAAGSAIAGAAFSFLLVELLDPFRLLFLLCAAASAGGLALTGRKAAPRAFHAGAGMLAAALVLLGAGALLDGATAASRWKSLQAGAEFLGARDSRYGRIAVTRYRGQTNFFASGHLAFSLPDPEGASGLAHPVLAEHLRPRKVLLVGGGVSGTVREILKHGVEKVVYVELDPVLVETAREFEPGETAFLDDPRVTFLPGDGRAAVTRAESGSFDVVLVDVPDPMTAALNRYYTREFFAEVRRVLRGDGIAAFTLSGAPNYMGDEIRARNGAIYHTFRDVFDKAVVWPGDTFLYVGAGAEVDLTLDPEILAERFEARAVPFGPRCVRCSRAAPASARECPACGGRVASHPWFTEHHYRMRLEEEDVRRVNRSLRRWPLPEDADVPGAAGEGEGGAKPLPAFLSGARDPLPAGDEPVPPAERALNTDANPAACLQNLLLWNRMMGERAWSKAARGAAALGGWWWALLAAVFVLPVAILFFVPGGRGQRGLVPYGLAVLVGCVGFAVLSFEMVALLSFQSQYGYVYREMGVLFGAFMLGLGLAGALALSRIPARLWTVLACSAGALVLALLLPPVLDSLRPLSPGAALPLYVLITGLCGVPIGMLFPLAAKLFAGYGGGTTGAASALYASDLAGGIAGALLTGPLLLPVLGVSGALQREVAPLVLFALLLLLGCHALRGKD